MCTFARWGKSCFPPAKEVHPFCSASLLPGPPIVGEDKAFCSRAARCSPWRRAAGGGDGLPSLQSQHKALQGFQPARDGEAKAAVAMEIMHVRSSAVPLVLESSKPSTRIS